MFSAIFFLFSFFLLFLLLSVFEASFSAQNSFIQYLLSTYYVPGSVLSIGVFSGEPNCSKTTVLTLINSKPKGRKKREKTCIVNRCLSGTQLPTPVWPGSHCPSTLHTTEPSKPLHPPLLRFLLSSFLVISSALLLLICPAEPSLPGIWPWPPLLADFQQALTCVMCCAQAFTRITLWISPNWMRGGAIVVLVL